MKKKLRDYQQKAFDMYKDSSHFGLLLPCGAGKAQPLSSLILAKEGYIHMGEVKTGMEIFDGEGELTLIEEVFYNGFMDCYRITLCDNTSFEVADEHINVIIKSNKATHKNWRAIITTKELIARMEKQKSYYFSVPTAIINGKAMDCDRFFQGFILAFTELFSGVYKYTGFNKVQERLFLTFMNKYNIPFKKEGRRYLISDCYSRIQKTINDALYGTLLTSSKDERIIFCQGAFTTLGVPIVDKVTRTTFLQLKHNYIPCLEKIANVFRSVGFFVKNPRMISGSDIGVCTLRFLQGIDLDPHKAHLNDEFYKKYNIKTCIDKQNQMHARRRIVSIEPVGKKACRCIKVSSKKKTYVTDNLIVTHNTTVTSRIAQYKDKPTIIIAPDALCNQWKNALIDEEEKEENIFVITTKEKNKKDFNERYRAFLER